jgi:penicillin-binding protein 1A
MSQNKSKQPGLIKRIKKKAFILRCFAIAFTVVFWLGIIAGLMCAFYAKDLPDLTEFANNDRKPQITIRSADGVVLAKYGDLHGKSLTYSQIPQTLIEAVVATEDQRFFEHFGFDIFGIIRAHIKNMRAGRYVQGGSTISQQLAKVVYLTPEKTLKRKILEVMISLQLEHKFTKEQLLTLYLNRIYLGAGNYGIDAASRYYFGKKAEDMDLYESAIIAGMIKAPSRYSPANNPVLSFERAQFVLDRMEDEGYITKEQVKTAIPPVIIKRGFARGALKNPYFTDYVVSEIHELIENPNQDLNVYTTFDLHAQEVLEATVAAKMQDSEKVNASQVAAIVMEPSGAIKAMIGGKGYDGSQFNRAVSSKRQPGSSFKVFVYTAAMENGYSPSDTFTDEPISYPQGPGLPAWTPKNFDDKFRGSMTLEQAFSKSINTIAVQVSEAIGRHKVVEMAKRLGIESYIPSLPSIALGSTDLTLLELTQAYAHIANHGLKTKAFGILQITDKENNVLYEFEGTPLESMLDEKTVTTMKQMLASVVENGTGRNANIPFKMTYGKTGTSQDFKDAWFIGFTDELVAGFWVGNDDNRPMKRISGGTLPAIMWKDFVTNVGEIKTTELLTSEKSEMSLFDVLFNDGK